MKKALSFALVLLLVTGLFAGGGKEETSSSSTGPVIKSNLVIGVAQEINEQNPMMQNDQINNNCFALTHERIIFVDGNNGYEIKPDIS